MALFLSIFYNCIKFDTNLKNDRKSITSYVWLSSAKSVTIFSGHVNIFSYNLSYIHYNPTITAWLKLINYTLIIGCQYFPLRSTIKR